MRFAVLFALLLTACARPNYAPPAPSPLTPAGETAACAIPLPKSGQCVHLTWTKLPTAEETGTLWLSVRSTSTYGLPTTTELQGELRAHLWMPSMSHGSTPMTIEKFGVGLYRLDEVYFIMPGDWTINIQVWKDGALFEEGLFALEI
ncbi:MAG: serine protease spb1 [Bdellovibrionaceae bacterium]|nr:serine protease spb1 [Pseudobdellovibrionaceae bacterium]